MLTSTGKNNKSAGWGEETQGCRFQTFIVCEAKKKSEQMLWKQKDLSLHTTYSETKGKDRFPLSLNMLQVHTFYRHLIEMQDTR